MDKFTTLTESYWFYDNTIELRFDTEDHKYYRVEELGNLTEIKGVTTDLSHHRPLCGADAVGG